MVVKLGFNFDVRWLCHTFGLLQWWKMVRFLNVHGMVKSKWMVKILDGLKIWMVMTNRLLHAAPFLF